MPEIKDYDGKKKNAAKNHTKRRPYREVEASEVQIEEVPPLEGEKTAESHPDKTHLEFYGSDVIREKAPKVMELVETVAEEWAHDGQFEGLPLGNPLAQIVAAKALRKAKDVEKKLEEKGVFTIAKMGFDYVKAEIGKRKK